MLIHRFSLALCLLPLDCDCDQCSCASSLVSMVRPPSCTLLALLSLCLSLSACMLPLFLGLHPSPSRLIPLFVSLSLLPPPSSPACLSPYLLPSSAPSSRSHNSLCAGRLLKTFPKRLRYGTGSRQIALSRDLQALPPTTSWVSSGAPGTISLITKCRSRASVSSASLIYCEVPLLFRARHSAVNLSSTLQSHSHTLTITCSCCHPADRRLPSIQQANQALH